MKYHESNAPPDVTLDKLAHVHGLRWAVEENFQTGKGECRLDEYETRGRVGWHHHTALSMLALAFLVRTHKTPAVKRWLLRHPDYHLLFIPTSNSWLNQAGRVFAAGTAGRARRRVFKSVHAREQGITEHLAEHNANPKLFPGPPMPMRSLILLKDFAI